MKRAGACEGAFRETRIVWIRGVSQMLPRKRKTAAHALTVLTLANVRFAEFRHSELRSPSARRFSARQAVLHIAIMATRARAEQHTFGSEENSGEILAVITEG